MHESKNEELDQDQLLSLFFGVIQNPDHPSCYQQPIPTPAISIAPPTVKSNVSKVSTLAPIKKRIIPLRKENEERILPLQIPTVRSYTPIHVAKSISHVSSASSSSSSSASISNSVSSRSSSPRPLRNEIEIDSPPKQSANISNPFNTSARPVFKFNAQMAATSNEEADRLELMNRLQQFNAQGLTCLYSNPNMLDITQLRYEVARMRRKLKEKRVRDFVIGGVWVVCVCVEYINHLILKTKITGYAMSVKDELISGQYDEELDDIYHKYNTFTYSSPELQLGKIMLFNLIQRHLISKGIDAGMQGIGNIFSGIFPNRNPPTQPQQHYTNPNKFTRQAQTKMNNPMSLQDAKREMQM
jgi:hypothetical protein